MNRFVFVVVVAAIAGLAGCPEKKEEVKAVQEKIGGAPKTEIDTANARLDASTAKIQQQAQEAAKASE